MKVSCSLQLFKVMREQLKYVKVRSVIFDEQTGELTFFCKKGGEEVLFSYKFNVTTDNNTYQNLY